MQDSLAKKWIPFNFQHNRLGSRSDVWTSWLILSSPRKNYNERHINKVIIIIIIIIIIS